MALSGTLTSSGILIRSKLSPVTCFSCVDSRNRSNEIKYQDVLCIERHGPDTYWVNYVDSSKLPSSMKKELVTLSGNISSQRESSTDLLNTDDPSEEHVVVEGTVEAHVMSKAYSLCRQPSSRLPILVIINPKSGPGNAQLLYEERSAPIFKAAGLRTKVIITKYSGEAKDISQKLAIENHDTIVLVSGDGLPHEVLNGLATREADANQALKHFNLAQLPGGSGNAMAISLNNGSDDWGLISLGIIKGYSEPHDIMCVSQGTKTFYSFLSQSFGIVADCDLGTESLRWMGSARFELGIAYKCLSSTAYPCEIAYKEGSAVAGLVSSLIPEITVNDPIPSDWKIEKHPNLSMFYVGKMPWMSSDALVFPQSEPSDGSMDMLVWDTSLGGINALKTLMKMKNGSHLKTVPFYKKIEAYRLTPFTGREYLSIDGESYSCAPLQVSIIPGAVKFVQPIV